MKLPEYVTIAEVQRVCSELGLRDWTQLSEAKVQLSEAEILLKEVNREGLPVVLEDFAAGLEVELEHGLRFPHANVTNNHPVLTGMIVMAHFEESLDYYQRLEVAELEGDLLKAIAAGRMDKAQEKYGKLVKAKEALSLAEARLLAGS